MRNSQGPNIPKKEADLSSSFPYIRVTKINHFSLLSKKLKKVL